MGVPIIYGLSLSIGIMDGEAESFSEGFFYPSMPAESSVLANPICALDPEKDNVLPQVGRTLTFSSCFC